MALLEVKKLNVYTNDNNQLVKNVDISIKEGETLAVVGESGSGKTLTALCLMDLLGHGLRKTVEKMVFEGRDLRGLKEVEWRFMRGREVAMIFQEPATALNPVMTCGAQVAEAFAIHTKMRRAARRKEVLALFRKVKLPQPERIWRAYPHEISGGQRQRVMIAMALAHKPKLLIADEPTTALDVTVQAEILALVKDIQREMGMAMLWITHDFGVVRTIADRVMVMEKGVVVEEGTVKQVLAKPSHAYTKKLLGATLELAVVRKENGETGKRKNSDKKKKQGEIVIDAAKLSHAYEHEGGFLGFGATPVWALKDVDVSLRAGEVLGVVGESGSGKSTLARVLTRLIPAAKGGRVVVMGRDLLGLRGEALRVARKDLQMVFQDPAASLNPKLTVGESVAEGVRAHRMMPARKVRGYVEGLLKQVGLPESAYGRYPHQLSGGQKQRVAIARALALEPAVLIADEAVSALDVSVQAQILALLRDLQQARGLSMIFITHDLRVVSHIADRVVVMKDGKVVEEGSVAAVFGKPRQGYTKRLVEAVV